MYYGNKAKVHIPNWWEIRKMCKGLERLKPAVSIIFGYDGCLDGIPRKSVVCVFLPMKMGST